MRKNLIAVSVAAFVGGLGMAGGAAANVLLDTPGPSTSNATTQVLQAGGVGHQLIIPYYNVQNGNATLFNVVNTDVVNGKAVKVRFRGASNSDDVFDFQVYLSPGDVWGATVTRGADGRAVLTSTDKSCTIPSTVSGTSFVTARLPSTLTVENAASQTREGYVEIFNMADIPPNAIDPAAGTALATANALYTAIKHVSGVAPCSGTAISNLQNDPADIAAARGLGFRAPTGTIFANWTIINVPKSGAASGEATSLLAAIPVAGPPSGNTPAFGNIVFFPQTGAAVGTVDNFTADPALRTINGGATGVQDSAGAPYSPTSGTLPIVTASSFDLPDLSTPYLSNQLPLAPTQPILQAETLTRALASVTTINEFLNDVSITAFTDWVFSLPTRRYSVALDYRPAVTPIRAFTKFVNRDYFTGANTSVKNGQICTSTGGITYYDREEFTAVGTSFVISPNPPAPGFALCGEASVLTFNSDGASVLGAEIAKTNFSTPGATNGWARVNHAGVATGGAFAVGGNGLPVLGKAFSRATNPAVSAGISANFGASWEHRHNGPATP